MSCLFSDLKSCSLVRTLDVSQSLLQELLLESGLGELGLDTGLDGLDEVELLRLSLLLLVSDPRVEDLLELGLDGVLLLESKVLVLELGDLLHGCRMAREKIPYTLARHVRT